MEILSNNQMKLSVSCLTILLTFFMIFNTSKIEAQALKTVKHVDIKSYAGKWFEIAAYPQRFQKGCHCTTAEYTMTDKGYLIVENKCNKDSITGKLVSIKGKAFVEKNADNAKLKVQNALNQRIVYSQELCSFVRVRNHSAMGRKGEL